MYLKKTHLKKSRKLNYLKIFKHPSFRLFLECIIFRNIKGHYNNRNWVNGKRIAYLKSSCNADHFEHKHDRVILKKTFFFKKWSNCQHNEKFGRLVQIMKFWRGTPAVTRAWTRIYDFHYHGLSLDNQTSFEIIENVRTYLRGS